MEKSWLATLVDLANKFLPVKLHISIQIIVKKTVKKIKVEFDVWLLHIKGELSIQHIDETKTTDSEVIALLFCSSFNNIFIDKKRQRSFSNCLGSHKERERRVPILDSTKTNAHNLGIDCVLLWCKLGKWLLQTRISVRNCLQRLRRAKAWIFVCRKSFCI